MNQRSFIYTILLPSLCVYALTVCSTTFLQLPDKMQQKKKILILTSSGGGGHVAATNALQHYLKDDYVVLSSFVFQEILGSFDPLEKITFGKTSCEGTYNFFIRRKFYGTLNVLAHFGSWYFKYYHQQVTNQLIRYLEDMQPDCVVSVVPFINKAVLEACEQLKIPFLLIPTDLDVSNFIRTIKNPTYEKFHLVLPLEDEKILEQVKQSAIPQEQVSISGFPLRTDFFKKKNMVQLKDSLQMPKDKPIIMILMGAAGSNSIYRFVKQLTKIQTPIHVITVLGRNEQRRSSINALKLPETMSMDVLGFTQNIADLMSVADICITKSGSVSFCEALYSEVPVLLDSTTTVLDWEHFNHEFTQKHFIGYVIKRYSTVPQMITQLLNNPHILKKMKANSHGIKKKRLDLEIRPILQKLLF